MAGDAAGRGDEGKWRTVCDAFVQLHQPTAVKDVEDNWVAQRMRQVRERLSAHKVARPLRSSCRVCLCVTESTSNRKQLLTRPTSYNSAPADKDNNSVYAELRLKS